MSIRKQNTEHRIRRLKPSDDPWDVPLNERQLTSLIMDYLKWALPDAWVRKNLGTLGQRKGIPDLEIIHQGTPYFLEVKTPRARLSKYQEAEIEALRRAGAQVHVIRSLEDVHRLFNKDGRIEI